MVNIQLGAVQTGAWTDNVGMFSGQNIQNSWDSHTPAVTSFGSMLGDDGIAVCHISWLYHQSTYNQPTYDQDIKGNNSPQHIL